MTAGGRVFDPLDAVSERLTALLGVFWLTGGAAVLASAPGGTYDGGWPPGVVGVGVVAVAVGLALLASHRRVLPRWAYAALTLIGALAISLVVFWAGPTADGAPGVLFVYVACFAFVSLRGLAPMLVAASAAMHLGAKLGSGTPAPFGQWLLIWGVALVTGLIVGRVVDAQRRLSDEQEHLLGQLRDADAAKTAFLYSVSHELARPMTAMVGLAETLASRGEDLPAAERTRLAERVAKGSRRLQGMLDGLLDLGRSGSETVSLDLAPVPIGEVVGDALDIADVPREVLEVEDGADVVVRADRVRLAHALANLVDNAVKYGGSEPVTVTIEPEDGAVVLGVADRGPGVPDEAKQAVFEPFERARREDVHHGTGIGLAIVRQFARLHGGDAWLEDRPGGGTRACLRLPREPEAG